MIYPWHLVPAAVRTDLLQASSGHRHLFTMAVGVLEEAGRDEQPQAYGRPFVLGLGGDLLAAAWEDEPLGIQLCTQLLGADQALSILDGRTRRAMMTIVAHTTVPDEACCARLGACGSDGDYDGLAALVADGFAREPDNLFWTALAVQIGFGANRAAWAMDILENSPRLPKALRLGFFADMALLYGDPAQAAAWYDSAFSAVPSLVWRERQGYALCRVGRDEEALACWDEVLSARSWHVQLWLTRDSVRRKLHHAGAFPDGPGVVLLYTWNGRDKIDQTLAGLAAAEWPQADGAQILLADNGSDDGQTPGILAAWADRLGERLRLISLPCNIGAPAARNWLMCEAEARRAEWVAYLDDDVIVPPDWLRHYGTIMAAEPDHTVYGCMVLRHDRPWCLQGAEQHLLPASRCAGPPPMPEAAVHMQAASWGEEQFHFGQFSYSRPCVHVAGCCHIFRRARFDAVGGFDVRFSPSQVDDFEHDIRMAVAGDWPYYHGALAVQHMHATGLSTAANLPKAMNAYANHLKLQALYPRAVFDSLREKATQILLQDVVRRQKA